jgi:hypothetical protein
MTIEEKGEVVDKLRAIKFHLWTLQEMEWEWEVRIWRDKQKKNSKSN